MLEKEYVGKGRGQQRDFIDALVRSWLVKGLELLF